MDHYDSHRAAYAFLYALTRIAIGVSVPLIWFTLPQPAGIIAAGAFAVWFGYALLWFARTKCEVCGSRHNTMPIATPHYRRRAWWDVRDFPPKALYWLCEEHFRDYIIGQAGLRRDGDRSPG